MHTGRPNSQPLLASRAGSCWPVTRGKAIKAIGASEHAYHDGLPVRIVEARRWHLAVFGGSGSVKSTLFGKSATRLVGYLAS
jgi:hypothetical protein